MKKQLGQNGGPFGIEQNGMMNLAKAIQPT